MKRFIFAALAAAALLVVVPSASPGGKARDLPQAHLTPGVPDERCNGRDDNNDGRVDEGFPDTDKDSRADCVDLDDDNDGQSGAALSDGADNCPQVANQDQLDTDNDGIGDRCDPSPSDPTPQITNPPSTPEITVDGQFEPPAGEWTGIIPASFLGGDSLVYSAVEDQDIYLMYDYRLNTSPLAIGQEVGPISFKVGASSFFDVFVDQLNANTNSGPHPTTSPGLDGVRVLLNGAPFDNTAGCIEGAVDNNTTSPNFPTQPHNLVELGVHLTNFGGCYSPEPAFWSATLPSVSPIGPHPFTTAAATSTTDNLQVSAASFTVNSATGDTAVTKLPIPESSERCNGRDDDGDGQIDEGFPGTDGDDIADCVDRDDDNDGVLDGADNCPQVANQQQGDTDQDGIGDACDPNTDPIVNASSLVEIAVDGQFGPPNSPDEWADITPVSFLSGTSKVYSAEEGGDIYLMYDYSLNTTPLAVGDEVGPISFQVGANSFFDVFVDQGDLNTNFGPHPGTSMGGLNDTVQVFLNGAPFNNVGCVEGAVDHNTTSPNFGGGHNLVELGVHLSGNPGECYSPEPEFWSATLPRVTVGPTAAPTATTTNVQVSAAFFDVDPNGFTHVTPLAFPGNPTAVTIASFTGRAVGGKAVRLSWRTSSEVDTLGFNVWRFANGKGVKVNPTLVAAKAAGRVGGATYRLLDRGARPGANTYRLQVVSQQGARAWRASTTVRAQR